MAGTVFGGNPTSVEYARPAQDGGGDDDKGGNNRGLMVGGDWQTPRAVVPFPLLGFFGGSLGTVGLLREGGVTRGGWG